LGRPIAAPLERCAQLLGVNLVTICEAATNVEPYIRADGTRQRPQGARQFPTVTFRIGRPK
jgi:hypothetical protein